MFILFLLAGFTAEAKEITVPKNPDGGWYYPDGNFPAKAGDVVLMDGDYAYIKIIGWNPGGYVTFRKRNPLTTVRVGTNHNGYSMVMDYCKYFIVDGLVIGNVNPTVYTENSFNFPGAEKFEVRNCIIQNAKVGFFSNLSTGHYTDIYIHDNIIRNISSTAKNTYSEGFYIGPSDVNASTEQTSFKNLRIENNALENIGGDGIQITCAVDVKVKNNSIKNYGFHNIRFQQCGILLGNYSSGVVEGNYLETGTGSALNALGAGTIIFRNNIAKGTATSPGQDGIYIRGAKLKVKLIGNILDKVNRNFIQVDAGAVTENTRNSFGKAIASRPVPQAKETGDSSP
ncbi:MAG: right-handed parallel beta-helix repeat-containing protein [Ferruginibacter sp.]